MKILGITDETTTCECCGKTNLKKTVVLETEDGGELRYGTDCAARALLGKKSSSNRKTIEERAKIVTLAHRWAQEGHTFDVIVNAIGRRGWGMSCSHKQRIIWIGDFAEIKVP